MESTDPTEREIRVALVLYGGISLAIYENGVTRCFSDLVRGLGVFGPLLRFLHARATVDVIAGTSAGGINGVLLAACLESGQDFAETAGMWRRLGDLGDLLRDVDTRRANSLIDGEGYFQAELVSAMRRFCEPAPRWKSRGEMDVFVTGTDVAGHEHSYLDGLGQRVDDREHRTVFHLRHRPGRKRLGLTSSAREIPGAQANILAAISRITSCFPVAFPPFRSSDFGAAATVVSAALDELSGVEAAGKAVYVDGGVLDNKPFGPALKAIFHRMPSGPVDRRLFYCEPDPVYFEPGESTSSAPDFTPLVVGLSALSSIPANESIGGDLNELKQHNQRIDWLRSVRKRIPFTDGFQRKDFAVYVETRIDALSRSLTIDGDCAPSAADVPLNEGRARLCRALRGLVDGLGRLDLDPLDRIDVHFHLRRAFHFLYEYYEEVEAGKASPTVTRAMYFVGRIVKALKLVRDYEVGLRELLIARVEPDEKGADVLLSGIQAYFASDEEHWAPLVAELEKKLNWDLKRDPDRKEDGVAVSSDVLNETAKQLTKALDVFEDSTSSTFPRNGDSTLTILDLLALKLRDIVGAVSDVASSFAEFDCIDAHMYPLKFASGIYELDRVEFVRISPGDAQFGLSFGDRRRKVAGDELAHFAALFRRDWRSNDILYGRLDGICQIVRSLLDTKALCRVLKRNADFDFSLGALTVKRALDRCPEFHLHDIEDSWKNLRSAWHEHLGEFPARDGELLEDTPEFARAWRLFLEAPADSFRKALIVAGQEQAVAEDLPTVYADMHYQEIAYGFMGGPDSVSGPANAGLMELQVASRARKEVARIPPELQSRRFRDLSLGSEAIGGDSGRVPNAMLGEYAAQAYLLLYGMLERSLGEDAGRLMAAARTKWIFRHPPRAAHAMLTLIRRERRFAAVMLIAAAFAGLGGIVTWWFTRGLHSTDAGYWTAPVICASILLVAMWALLATSRGDGKANLVSKGVGDGSS